MHPSTDQSLDSATPANNEPRPAAWAARLAGLLIAFAAVRVAFILFAPLDLSGDEAQYWDWSRQMQWCYFSKGPAVAACIWVGRLVLGETVLAVRGPAVVLSSLTSLVVFLLGRRLHNARVGFWAAILVQIVPLFAALGIGMTADPPFLLGWALSLLFLHRAVADNRWADWLALGVAIGLGLLSKYTMAMFYPLVLGYLLTSRERRARLATTRPWIATAISLAFLIPLLWWNSQNGWVNFRHNLGHTGYGESASLQPLNLLIFLGSQLAIITPILAVMLVWACWRQRKSDPFCLWFSIPFLAFFTLKSLQGHDYANWTLVGYVTGLIAFAAAFLQRQAENRHVRRLTRAAWLTPAIATPAVMLVICLGHFSHLLGRTILPANPYQKLTGWVETGRAIERLPDRGRCFIVASSRLLTAHLAFYMPSRPKVFQMRLAGQEIDSQYDLWPGYETLVGCDAMCVVVEKHPDRVDTSGRPVPPTLNRAFAAQFASVDLPIYPVAMDAHGRPIRLCAVYVGRTFRGPTNCPATAADQPGGQPDR